MSVVEHLEQLIRIPSVSAVPNRPLIEYARAVLRDLGWTTQELLYRDAADVEKVNLVAAPAGQNVDATEVELAFVCHTDTVPFAADWPEATEPVIEDGNVHGCGACDVKGILACLLTAAAACHGEYVDGLRIVLTADEEVGCIGAARLLEARELKARRMVIGEPTQLHVARAGKGYCLARMVFTGVEAHSAHPSHGASAIFAAARMVVVLEELAEQLQEETNSLFDPPFTTLNIGTISGGTAKNIIPGRCEILVEWRPIPGDDLVFATIEGLVEEFEAADDSFACEIELLREQPGFETDAKALLVREIVAATGREAVAIPFGSEASVFSAVTEEIVVFGPGDIRTAHSDRECVPIAELDEAIRIMSGLMRGDLSRERI